MDCRSVVSSSWKLSNPTENCWDNFKEKCKNCKKALLAWNKAKNAVVEISKLKIKLQKLLNEGNSNSN